MRLSASQLTALRNLARKQDGEAVDWIRIADARALTDLGFAERGRAGWTISPAGLAALKTESPQADAEPPADSVVSFGDHAASVDKAPGSSDPD